MSVADKAMEALDKAVTVYENAEDVVRENWKPAAIGAVGGAVGAALLWFWIAK